MSWSIAVFSPRREPITIEEIEHHLADLPPVLHVIFSAPPENVPSGASANGLWSDLALSEDGAHIVARVQAIAFDTECAADPQLMEILKNEIVESDAEDGEVDEEYTSRLHTLLQQSCWHYVISVRQNGRPSRSAPWCVPRMH
jgi:hypothetical protein